ncbi:MAG: response regulator transcription factor [Bdellovibrionales bacterium]
MAAKTPQILVVEDERSHQLIIQKSLAGFYEFELAENVQQAQAKTNQKTYDLILLDIVLPDGTGFEVLNHLRKGDRHHLTPVIFLTVREDLKSKLTGFSLGADDYMVKPPEPLELRARIDAKLRVINELKDVSKQPSVQIADMTLDTERLAVLVQDDGKSTMLDLTPLEFRLLLFFAKHPNEAMSRQTILLGVWGSNTHVLDRSVDSYVATLRRKLGTRGNLIKSVHKVGYRLNPNYTKKTA